MKNKDNQKFEDTIKNDRSHDIFLSTNETHELDEIIKVETIVRAAISKMSNDIFRETKDHFSKIRDLFIEQHYNKYNEFVIK